MNATYKRGFIGTLILLVLAIFVTYTLTSQHYERKMGALEAHVNSQER